MIYIRCGKQILRDGQHFGDGDTEANAITILAALNAHSEPADTDRGDEPQFPLDDDSVVLSYDWVRSRNHTIRREQDEIVCSCGKRYGVDEEHP